MMDLIDSPAIAQPNANQARGPGQGEGEIEAARLIAMLRCRFNALTPAQRKAAAAVLTPHLIATLRLLFGDEVARFLARYHQRMSPRRA